MSCFCCCLRALITFYDCLLSGIVNWCNSWYVVYQLKFLRMPSRDRAGFNMSPEHQRACLIPWYVCRSCVFALMIALQYFPPLMHWCSEGFIGAPFPVAGSFDPVDRRMQKTPCGGTLFQLHYAAHDFTGWVTMIYMHVPSPGIRFLVDSFASICSCPFTSSWQIFGRDDEFDLA